MLSCRRKQTKSRETMSMRVKPLSFRNPPTGSSVLFPSLFLTVTMHGCFLDVSAAFSWGGGGGPVGERRMWIRRTVLPQGLHSLSWPLEKSVGAILGRFTVAC